MFDWDSYFLNQWEDDTGGHEETDEPEDFNNNQPITIDKILTRKLMSFNNSLPDGFNTLSTKKPYINLGKLAEGEYKFRIVSRPIAGWLDWKDKKPLRFRPSNKPAESIDRLNPMKPFWAIYVWDYKQEGLYIMEVTQNTIRCALEDLALNEDWGDLTSFDFKIKKTGAGKETSYSVTPVPHKPLDKAIEAALAVTPVRLDALYEGKDPWTDLVPSKVIEEPFIGLTEKQSANIDGLLQKINDRSFQQELEGHFKVTSIHNIEARDYERAILALEARVKSKTATKEKGNGQRVMAGVA